MCNYQVAAFYKFVSIDPASLSELRERIIESANTLQVRGLMILSVEGCNATVAGLPGAVTEFKYFLQQRPEVGTLVFKDSFCEFQPFRRFKLDIRPEIVTFAKDLEINNINGTKRLSPAEWESVLKSGEDVLVLDTRNTYEFEVGKFKGAIVPPIRKFSEFRQFVENSGIPKDKKVLMYCTGGIRCEKASLEMERQGFKNVYQLDGGILKYLEQFPDSHFEGECFVFDHRVSVDQRLQPSKRYKLCPHCGNAADRSIECAKCGDRAVVCVHCLPSPCRNTCSKNCAAHLERYLSSPAKASSAAL